MADSNTSQFNQLSFSGGMNMLGDDTRISGNQYRVGFNIRNRFDQLDLIQSSIVDDKAPLGIKQEMTTFGSYEILFVNGGAYYKLYTDVEWTKIPLFQMSATAPRFWTKAIPVATTNYLRIAATSTAKIDLGNNASVQSTAADGRGTINVNSIAGAAQGNLPGLLVQDNINQPWFIFIGADGYPTARQTQRFNQWQITFTDADCVTVRNDKTQPSTGSYVPVGDLREYVPIGNFMEYVDGVLYVASPDGQYLLQSVSGRPLDFVRNVTNQLAQNNTNPPYTLYGGGDAYTTAYSVGVGPITCLRAMSDGSLFVGAANANFSVAKNYANNAPLEYGEFPLKRTFLFNAVCLSDRAIFDSIGDTRFITLGGVRSFNAIRQSDSEGRNLPFTATIQKAFDNIIQDTRYSAAILYNDFELYAVTTIFGPAIAVFDTILGCWVGFDIAQVGGSRIKQFAKIELSTQALFAVTEDNKVYRLYCDTTKEDVGMCRIKGMCSNAEVNDLGQVTPTPQMEVKLTSVRVIQNGITKNCSCSVESFVNNRLSKSATKDITYAAPIEVSDSILALDDVNTQLSNLFFNFMGSEQGWKTFCTVSWTNGSITQFSAEMTNITPRNPLNSQINTK